MLPLSVINAGSGQGFSWVSAGNMLPLSVINAGSGQVLVGYQLVICYH
ncbi:MAG: hypothetical protein ACJBCI_06210 [Candidatus Tisiphia sp.]